MSLQGRLRFNPKNYVRTVFFGLHGDDNNSGLNEDKLKRNFYGAVAAANLIVLGAGERGCIIGLGAGEFDHEDTANNGDLTVPDNWDVFMPHQILNIAVGTGGAGASKLVTNRNAIMAYGIKMNDGADWAIEDANANVEVRLQTLQAAAAASGKLHVKTTATNCQLSFEAASLTAVDKLMLLESDTGSFDIEFNTLSTGGPVLTITNPLFDIVGMDGTLRPFKMTTSGSSGTITGVKTSGDAKVCVISNAFMGFDVDYETAGTSEMGVITCTDNGNNIQGAGSILVLNHQMTYVRTIFVNENGLDTNDGANPERAVATIPRALQIAAGIVLGADEVGIIKVTDASNYEHSSAAYGDGAEEIPLLWKLDMGNAGLIGFSGGSGNVLTLKNYAGLDVRFLDLRGGFNVEIIDAFSSNRLNVQNFNCSDNTYGKLHVKPTATNCDIYINIKNPEVGTGGILLEPASGHINLVTGTFDVTDTSTTYNLIEVKDCNVSYSFGDIRMTPGAGTITGLRAKGTAEVCIIGNDNQADIDFATEDTATISGFVCMDRGTASEAGGAITLLTPSGLDLAATLLNGNTSGASNIQMSGVTQIQFGGTVNHVENGATGNLEFTTNKSFKFLNADSEQSLENFGVFKTIKNSTTETMTIDAGTGSIGYADGTVGGTIDMKSALSAPAKSWTMPDKTGTVALLSDIPAVIGTTATAQSTNYTAAAGDFVLMTTGATDKTVTLPAAASNTNAVIEIKKVDAGAGNLIIDGNGAETIDGLTTQTILTQYTSLTLHCDGTEWWIK